MKEMLAVLHCGDVAVLGNAQAYVSWGECPIQGHGKKGDSCGSASFCTALGIFEKKKKYKTITLECIRPWKKRSRTIGSNR